MRYTFKPTPAGRSAKEGDIIRDYDPGNWREVAELRLTPEEYGFETAFLDCVEGVLDHLRWEREYSERSPEPVDLRKHPEWRRTISFKFATGKAVTLAQILEKPELYWPKGCGVLYAFRGEPAQIACAVLRRYDGRFCTAEEVQLELTVPGQRIRVIGGSALVDVAFAEVGILSMPYPAVKKNLDTAAAAIRSAAGNPDVLVEPMLAVMPVGRRSRGATDLPKTAVALRNQSDYLRMQRLVREASFLPQAIPVLGIDLPKVKIPFLPDEAPGEG